MRLNVSGDCDCEFCSATGTGTVSLPGCCRCPVGTGTESCPECWIVTITGVVPEDPSDVDEARCNCEDFSRQYILYDDDICTVYDFPNDCQWVRFMGESAGPGNCAEPPFTCFGIATGVWAIRLGVPPKGTTRCIWTVVLEQYVSGITILATYRINNCDYNCKGKLTLNKVFDSPGSCLWPSQITIEPSSFCFLTGTGTFGTGTRACDNFTCIWEFQDIGGGQWVIIFDGCPNSSNPNCGCNIIPPFNDGLVFGDQHWLPCTTVAFPVCAQLECVWEFDGSVWNIIYDGCYFVGSCICGAPPAIIDPDAGDQETTPCIGA